MELGFLRIVLDRPFQPVFGFFWCFLLHELYIIGGLENTWVVVSLRGLVVWCALIQLLNFIRPVEFLVGSSSTEGYVVYFGAAMHS